VELSAEVDRELFGDSDAGDVAEGGGSAAEVGGGAGAPALDEDGVLNLI